MCGIGGKTIAEAKRNLSWAEARDWFLFAEQRGGLKHSERLLATIATQANHFAGGEAEIFDFLPYMKPADTPHETPAEIGEVMNILAMVAL